MPLQLTTEKHPIYCRDCGSVHVSIKEQICYACGSTDLNEISSHE